MAISQKDIDTFVGPLKKILEAELKAGNDEETGGFMITHKGTQIIKTERLLLRKIHSEDAEMVYKWMSDSKACKYECWSPHQSVDFTRGYIVEVFGEYKSELTYQWGIQLGKELIGSVSIVNVNDYHQKALLGYCLRKEYWSKGYMTEAVKAVLHYMLFDIGINRIEATHSINNIASGRVLEKVGMILEGHAKDYYFCNSGLQDSNLYEVTKTLMKS